MSDLLQQTNKTFTSSNISYTKNIPILITIILILLEFSLPSLYLVLHLFGLRCLLTKKTITPCHVNWGHHPKLSGVPFFGGSYSSQVVGFEFAHTYNSISHKRHIDPFWHRYGNRDPKSTPYKWESPNYLDSSHTWPHSAQICTCSCTHSHTHVRESTHSLFTGPLDPLTCLLPDASLTPYRHSRTFKFH